MHRLQISFGLRSELFEGYPPSRRGRCRGWAAVWVRVGYFAGLGQSEGRRLRSFSLFASAAQMAIIPNKMSQNITAILGFVSFERVAGRRVSASAFTI